MIAALVRAVLLMALAPAAQAGCAADPAPCAVAGGTYQAVLPPGGGTGAPAILFLHGWGGDGMGTLSNTGMVDRLIARGYAVIAPDGQPREGQDGRGWAFRSGAARDDVAFLGAVADDAAMRFGLDRGRMVLAGFSVGGSMVSYAACAAPEAFMAYAPVAGAFWRPEPDACAGPVRLFHTHGWTDRTVPLEGRSVGGGAATQGDVFRSLDIWRAANGCGKDDPDESFVEGDALLRRWQAGCAAGTDLMLWLHPGGHMVPEGWADRIVDWVEGLPG